MKMLNLIKRNLQKKKIIKKKQLVGQEEDLKRKMLILKKKNQAKIKVKRSTNAAQLVVVVGVQGNNVSEVADFSIFYL